ncbi:hypothetical protein BdWA1_003478 [Babesia duncani]|uniref:Uncharacterized protein n=1 Tax=Babesia duncani TaxID=323732 RepID=A0AAD9UMY2_9APIC|nr:hypothetical protein BdWA1_003478 [Babesia duncani]
MWWLVLDCTEPTLFPPPPQWTNYKVQQLVLANSPTETNYYNLKCQEVATRNIHDLTHCTFRLKYWDLPHEIYRGCG